MPDGRRARPARWTIIVDPIDGTRGLMYQKRPAWILTGVAPGPGPRTLADIELAVQTEIPLVKQHLSDELWAVRGQGASAIRFNRLTGESAPLDLRPSTATTIAHGFATISRFFPGNRAELAAIDDEVVAAVLGPPQPARRSRSRISTSHWRSAVRADGRSRSLRRRPAAAVRAAPPGGAALCCHPYDLCTELIARELGVSVTDEHGRQLAAPLDVTSDVSWIGYANDRSGHGRAAPAARTAAPRPGRMTAAASDVDRPGRRSRPRAVRRATSPRTSTAAPGPAAARRNRLPSSSRARLGGSTSWGASPITRGRSSCSGRFARPHASRCVLARAAHLDRLDRAAASSVAVTCRRRGRRRTTPVRRGARLVRRGSDPALGGVCRRRVPCARARAWRDASRTAPPS